MKSIVFKSTVPAVITKFTTAALLLLALAACGGSSGSSGGTKKALPQLPAPHPSAAASISLAAVDLTWDAVAGVTDYKIYYAKDSLDGLNGGYKNYATVGGKVVTVDGTGDTIGDLSADTTYYFVVAANHNGKESAAPEVSADSSYIAELAMGGNHGCVRLNTGSIKCWGYNNFGQLGVDNTADRHTATSVDLRAKQLSAGSFHTCAIDLSNRLHCWGNNEYSQLGLSGGSDRRIPTLVTQDDLAKVSVVSAGYTSTCAQAEVSADGKNYCWGDQRIGALGNGDSSSGYTEIAQEINKIIRDVKQFALGDKSGCAIDASDFLWCWGDNKRGQVGDDTTTDQTSPVNPKLQESRKATMLDGKSYHYCVVDNANKIQCWGSNSYGQLGIGSKSDSIDSPQYVLDSDPTSVYLSNVSNIATGSVHSCALIADGKVRCWGKSDYGIIGSADATADRLIADTYVQDINNAIDIAAGFEHTCVLLADKARVKCWGANGSGQLGNNTTISSATPVAVLGL